MANRKLFLPILCSFVLMVGTLAQQASASTIAGWTFETSQPALNDSATIGGIAAEVGAGTASGTHASAATDWSNPVGNGSNESLSSNTWAVDDYYQFAVDASLFKDIKISWDQTRSSTGPSDFNLQYSTDGSTFTTFASYVVPAITWSSASPDATLTTSFAQDLTSVTALNFDSSIFFRLTATSGPSSAAGSNRVDNVVVSGVPEPTTCALMLFGIVGMISRRRL